jgi:hypothetical protein
MPENRTVKGWPACDIMWSHELYLIGVCGGNANTKAFSEEVRFVAYAVERFFSGFIYR